MPPSRWPDRVPEASGPGHHLPHSSMSPTQEAEARNSAGAGPEGSGALDQQKQDGESRSPSQTGEGWRPQYLLPDAGPATLGVGEDLSTARNSPGLLGGGWSSMQRFQDLGCWRLIQTAVLVTDRTQNANRPS